MGRLRAPVVLIACVAVGVAATNTSHDLGGPAQSSHSRETTTPGGPSPTVRVPDDREALQVATRYALAATNWTARDRLAAWRRELALASSGYRRALQQARPTSSQLRALRADAARNRAAVAGIQIRGPVEAGRTRVLVWLSERTSTRAGSIVGQTRNRVRLQQQPDGHWLVSGWTTATDGSGG